MVALRIYGQERPRFKSDEVLCSQLTKSHDIVECIKRHKLDLDLHCLLRQGMSCSAREGLSGPYDIIRDLNNVDWAVKLQLQ